MSRTVTGVESATPHDLRSEPFAAAGMSLHRLVRCARLTSAQATVVAVDVWRAAGELRPAGTDDGTAPARAVRIDEHGSATLTSAVSLGAVVSALCGAVGNADDELRRALADAETTTDRAAYERLADAVAPVEHSARAELGALVRAWTGARPEAATPQLVTDDRAAPAAWHVRRPPRLGRRVWQHVWRPLAGLVVFAVVVGVELTSLRGQLEHDLSRLGGTPALPFGQPSTTPTTQRPSLGPAAAGAVLGVTVRTDQVCRPGARCPLTVSIRLRPAPKPTTVSWSVELVDPCRGGTPVTRAGGSARVRAHASRVVAVRDVRLPHAAALDVYAVTTRPASAASSPLLLPPTKTGTPRC